MGLGDDAVADHLSLHVRLGKAKVTIVKSVVEFVGTELWQLDLLRLCRLIIAIFSNVLARECSDCVHAFYIFTNYN